MSDTPTTRRFAHPPLQVFIETGPASGEFVLDPRCRVEEIRRVCGGVDFSTAEITAFAGPINSPSAGLRAGLTDRWIEPSLKPARFLSGGSRPDTPFTVFIHPNQRIVIARDWPATETEEQRREVFFIGNCETPRYEQTQNGAHIRESYLLSAEDEWKRQNLTSASQILGCRMRTAQADSELKAYYEAHKNEISAVIEEPFLSASSVDAFGDIVHSDADPCVFNPNGRPNRSAAPIEVMLDAGDGPQLYLFHVFTHVDDPYALPWTYAQALRYLLLFHLLVNPTDGAVLSELLNPVKDGGEPEEWPAPAGILPATEELYEGIPVIELSSANRPFTAPNAANALTYALLGEPVDLDCDDTRLAEALNLICETAGLRYMIRPELDEDEKPVSRLHIWARGAGRARDFTRMSADPAWSRSGLTVQELLDQNNVQSLSLQRDYTTVYPNPIVVGDREQFEITCELVPGWKPNNYFDNKDTLELIIAALKAAKEGSESGGSGAEELGNSSFYSSFNKKGLSFERYRNVGRLWVLNEFGDCIAKRPKNEGEEGAGDFINVFARKDTPGQPYNEFAYIPWNPKKCEIKRAVMNSEGSEVIHVPVRSPADGDPSDEIELIEGRPWLSVPRPLQHCFSADAFGHSLGIWIEVAVLDSDPEVRQGELEADHRLLSWKRFADCNIINLEHRAGIYIDNADLVGLDPFNTVSDDPQFFDEEEEPLSYVAALIESRLLLRVTAVIRGDHRCRPRLVADATKASRLFDVSKKFHQNRRDLANSIFAPVPEGVTPESWARPVGNQTIDTDSDENLERLQKSGVGLLAVCASHVHPCRLETAWVTQNYDIGDTIGSIEGMDLEFDSPGESGHKRYPDVVGIVTTPTRTAYALEDQRALDEMLDSKTGIMAVDVASGPAAEKKGVVQYG